MVMVDSGLEVLAIGMGDISNDVASNNMVCNHLPSCTICGYVTESYSYNLFAVVLLMFSYRIIALSACSIQKVPYSLSTDEFEVNTNKTKVFVAACHSCRTETMRPENQEYFKTLCRQSSFIQASSI